MSEGCEKFKMSYDYLAHHGIKGMHWGIRRYQNSDGSLTAEGKKRYSSESNNSNETFRAKRLKKAIEANNRDIASLSKYKDSGIYTKNGRQILTSDDIKEQIAGIESVRRKNESLLKKEENHVPSKIKDALTSDTAKKVYAGVAVAATVAGAAYLYSRNKGAVDSFVKSAAKSSIDASKRTISAGKQHLDKAMKSLKSATKNKPFTEKEFVDNKTIRAKTLNNAIKTKQAVNTMNRKVDKAISRTTNTAYKVGKVAARSVSNATNNVKNVASNWKNNFSKDMNNLHPMLNYISKQHRRESE